MSFTAILTMSGKTYRVISAAYDFRKASDQYGKPKQGTDGGLIALSIESSADPAFLKWILSPTLAQEGEIVFMKRDTMAAMRRLKFSNGYCLNYAEMFSDNGETPMMISIQISCSKMEIDGEIFDKGKFWGAAKASSGAASSQPEPAGSSSSGGSGSFIPD